MTQFAHSPDGIRIVFNEVQRTGNAVSGVDGATVNPNVFNSAGSLFQTDGIKPGDVLIITGGADAGTYVVATVPLETQLTITGTWPVGGTTGNTFAVSSTDFNGDAPDVSADEPKYGSIVYDGCADAGLFKFQAGVSPWGADPFDWIKVWRVIPYIDLANITDFTISFISPEVAQSGLVYPEAEWVSDLADYTGTYMEKLVHLAMPVFTLRPGSQMKITTVGAEVPQMVEVWWERARQIRPNSYGNEYFAYGV